MLEVLLRHLYDLQDPNLDDMSLEDRAALFHAADKFGIEAVRIEAMHGIIRMTNRGYVGSKEEHIKELSEWIAKIWTWKIEGAEDIKAVILEDFIGSGDVYLRNQAFKELLQSNKEFREGLLLAMNEKVKEQKQVIKEQGEQINKLARQTSPEPESDT